MESDHSLRWETDEPHYNHHYHDRDLQRALTFIDAEAEPPTEFRIATYSILTLISFLCFLQAVAVGNSRTHYRRFVSVRYLFPLACLVICLEEGTLAASGRFHERENLDSHVWLQTLYVLTSITVPILLIVIFEMTYLIHKRRSVNFCGMYFDEGRRVSKIITTPMASFCLRNMVRAVAVVLFAVEITVNLDLLRDEILIDSFAGRTGWVSLFQDDRSLDQKAHILLSLIPTGVLIVVSFYLSLVLWRYGTQSSMVVHSSILNPWFSPFFGTLALAVGQLFSDRFYRLMSNISFIVYITSIILLMSEVDKDMVAASDFTVFLGHVAKKANRVSTLHQQRSSKNDEKRQQPKVVEINEEDIEYEA